MRRAQVELFDGTERFEVRSHLGAGTSGDVYRVYDHRLRSEVALKTLHHADPASLYRFKREFRALADVHHTNLVQLYELLSDDGRWFFTMELVDGEDFVAYVRGATPQAAAPPAAPPQPARLRSCLRQLVAGLAALHQAGKLHCDVKPSNIRVTPEGRVVLLDFGLVQEEVRAGPRVEQEIAGTPAYMSPERAAGRPVTAASDWYSVGVVLFQALTGRLPFAGGFAQVLAAKQSRDAPSAVDLVDALPEDLVALCDALLARDPGRRPRGAEVARRLGTVGTTPRGRRVSSSSGLRPFVGRAAQLAELEAAFEASRRGETVVVLIHGSSGLGKTALVRRFLDRVRARDERAVVLSGRCYERESVPYKAMDSLVDALGEYLRQLPRGAADVLMPTNVAALARLFPALRRVEAVVAAERKVLDIPDEREQKRRARTALRELLARLAERRPVLLHVDDLQWGDAESADLLLELLRPPAPPPLMLLACFRSEEKESSPLLRRLLRGGLEAAGTAVRQLELGPMTLPESRALAAELLGGRPNTAVGLAAAIARESEGSPFFVAELVRHVRSESALGEALLTPREGDRRLTLGALIAGRLAQLPAEARELLEVLAVAGQPIDLEAAVDAAGLGEEAQSVVTLLRASSLLRIRTVRQTEEVEPYHERIREAVLDGLEGERLAALHRRLANALEASGRADLETLAIHFHGAGQQQRAAELFTAAAEEARAALAFARAARLYRLALELGVTERTVERRLETALGDVLTQAGRGADAAVAYLAAARDAPVATALELRRRAAEQQLICGRVDEGIASLRQVLAAIGMRLARTPRRAFLSLLLQRLRLKLRGLAYRRRDPTEIAAETLIRVDCCWAVAARLAHVDTIRAMDFGTRHLLLALAAGEEQRIARALAIEAAYSAAGGSRTRRRTARLVRAAMALAERVEEPHSIALAQMTAGVAAVLEGRWRRGLELLDRAEALFRERCTAVTWELDTCATYRLRSLYTLGQLDEVQRSLAAALDDVRERGDLYAETNLRARVGWLVRLFEDRPELALQEVEESIARWSRQGYHLQHYWQLDARVDIALYRGAGAAAWSTVEEGWSRLRRAQLLRVQFKRVEAWHLRSRAALAAALETQERRRRRELLAAAAAGARKMTAERVAWATASARLVEAALTALAGDRATALDLLVSATASFAAADMELYAAVSRLRRGELHGGERGKELADEAERWLRQQGVREPARLADVLAPGRWR